MKINSKKLPKNIMEITVELSTLEMAPFSDQALEELGKEITVSGFRRGMAPKHLVRQQVDEIKILEKTAEIAVNKKYPEIIAKALETNGPEKIELAGPANIEMQKIAPNNPFIFKLIVPLLPEIELGDYKKIKIKRKKNKIENSDIDKALKELQWTRRKETLANRSSQLGDRVELDLNLFINKVPLDQGQIKNFSVILGQDQYLPGLSENIKGLSAGQEKEFSYRYPDSHYDKQLAGKLVDFKAKIKNVYAINLPPIDDELGQSFGKFKNLEELKNKIKENLETEAQDKEEQRLEIEILKQLIEKAKIGEIPEILIEHELEKMINELKMSVENPHEMGSAKFDDYLQSIKKTEEDLKKGFIPKAEERIKTALCIRKIAQEKNIKVGEEEIKQEMDKLIELYKGQEKSLENLKTEDGQIYIK
ncbi:trigger factor, partial [Patescibacteria group bacterium]|nr:trigger factor [Patescibacteria group bacterium]